MVLLEHFIYGLNPHRGFIYHKTPGVSTLLTDEQRRYLIDKGTAFHTPTRFWIELDDVLAVGKVHPVTDVYGRKGVWLHVILCPRTLYYHLTDPAAVFTPYFIDRLDDDAMYPLQLIELPINTNTATKGSQ